MTLVLILIAAVLPALGLLYFIYRKDDLRQEPPSEILKAFALGALSVPASFLVSYPLKWIGLYPEVMNTLGDSVLTSFFGAGIPEELAKLVLLFFFVRRCRYFDEWVDGIVYAACVGLGFAAVENILYLFTNMGDWISIGALRAVLSVPGHFFFAVTMGYFFSRAWFGDPSRRLLNSALAFIVPMLLHGAFDTILFANTLLGGAAVLIDLFLALYIFMAVKSRKFYLEHRRMDMISPQITRIDK